MESKSWRDELASLVEDTCIIFPGDSPAVLLPANSEEEASVAEEESLKDQIKGFAVAWGELVVELGRGFRDVV